MKTTFTKKELVAALTLMEEGKIHFCQNCGHFIHDTFWKEGNEAEKHIYSECTKGF